MSSGQAAVEESPNTGIVVGLASAILIGSVFSFVNSNFVWLRPFGRDLSHWLLKPQIGGPPTMPSESAVWLVLVVLASTAAWLISGLVMGRTQFGSGLSGRIGLSIVLSVALIGYAGMLAIVAGRLEAMVLWGLIVGALVVTVAAALTVRLSHHVASRPAESSRGDDQAPSGIRWVGRLLAIASIGLTSVHALMAPITEIDATIYHAAAARLWFLERPSPPLLYGPSVGIEISANYPPLFPSIGATTYTVLGQFDDAYLRVVSPIVAIGLVLLTFAYTRWHSGSEVAWWVVILLLGSPLVVMYAAWATNYMLLAALTLVVLIFCEVAARERSLVRWGVAGAFAGLAILTNFYGWFALGFAVIAALVWMRSSRGLVGVGIFLAAAAVVASPWLIRNWVLLGDPVYPLGDAVFKGRGLVQPLWTASQSEIEYSALNVLGNGQGIGLFGHEVVVALQSGYLIPAGFVLGLVVGMWRSWQGDKPSAYLTAATSMLLLIVLAPGWYWLRALVPIIPIGTVLTGRTIQLASAWASRNLESGRGITALGAGVWRSTLFASAIAAVVTSLALSLAGPSQQTWTPALPQSSDFMQSVRNLGSPTAQLSTAFDGDFQSWQWVNQHTDPADRVATFELRSYYFDRPSNLFYLDGIEAVPLLRLTTSRSAVQFLVQQRVRYVLIPGWALGLHPAVSLLPLMTMLGQPDSFPIINTWGATSVYGVNAQPGPS